MKGLIEKQPLSTHPFVSLSLQLQVLFDDIGPSMILLSSPELQLRLLLHFLSFLGLPVDPVLSAEPRQPGLLLENLSVLTQGNNDTTGYNTSCLDFDEASSEIDKTVFILGNELNHPLTSSSLPELVANSVGHMTTLQGTRKWAGLGKQGEKFLTNVFSMVQPVLPAQHRAVLSLSWMQYEKLKVTFSLSDSCQI